MSDRIEPVNNEPLKPLLNFLERTKNTKNNNMLSQRNHIQRIYDELKQYDKKFLNYIIKKNFTNTLKALIDAINNNELGKITFNTIHNNMSIMLSRFYLEYMNKIFNTIKKNKTINSSILQPTINNFITYIESKSKPKYFIPNDQFLSDYKTDLLKKQTHTTPLINASTTSNQTIQTIKNNIFPLLSIITIVLVIVVEVVMRTKEGFCIDDDQYIITVIIITIIIIIYRYV